MGRGNEKLFAAFRSHDKDYRHSHICKNPSKFITDRSKAVVLLWFSVVRFGVRVSVTFHLTCVYIGFGSVWVSEWQPFGK